MEVRGRVGGPDRSGRLLLGLVPAALVALLALSLLESPWLASEPDAEVALAPPSQSTVPSSPTIPTADALPGTRATPRPSEQRLPPLELPPPLEPLPPDALRLVEATGNRVVVAGIPLRFDVPFPGWEAHERPYVSKSDHGPQGAEAIVFWTALPWSESASPCERMTDASSRPTPMTLADAIAGAPLTDVVAAPRRTTFDGFPAVTVVVRVKIPLACDPGFFVAWHPYPGGALWPNVAAGDTYRAWVVDVDGALLLVGLGTRADAGEEVAREAGEIVRSMRLADVTTS